MKAQGDRTFQQNTACYDAHQILIELAMRKAVQQNDAKQNPQLTSTGFYTIF